MLHCFTQRHDQPQYKLSVPEIRCTFLLVRIMRIIRFCVHIEVPNLQKLPDVNPAVKQSSTTFWPAKSCRMLLTGTIRSSVRHAIGRRISTCFGSRANPLPLKTRGWPSVALDSKRSCRCSVLEARAMQT